MRRFRRRRYFLYSCPLSNEMQLTHFRCFLRRQCKLLHSRTTPKSLRLLPITIDTQYTCVPGSPLTANKSKSESNGEVIGKGKIDYMIDLMTEKEKK